MFWKRSAKQPGWMVVAADGTGVGCVHGRFVPGAKPQILQYTPPRPADEAGVSERAHPDRPDRRRQNVPLARLSRELGLGHYDCATLLRPGDYQMLLVEAPNVPRDELKTAIRWRIKDLIDHHVDDVTIDVLDVPVEKDSGSRAHSMYAVVARSDLIRSTIKSFEEAHIPLSVIDIPETAQRNIASLYEDDDRVVALLHFDVSGGLLTLSRRGELCLTRRLDIGSQQIAAAGTGPAKSASGSEPAEGAFDRVLLELQRTFDHFERQSRLTLRRLMLGPEESPSGLLEFLQQNLEVPVERVALGEMLDFAAGQPIGPADACRLFYLIGSSLRYEAKAL